MKKFYKSIRAVSELGFNYGIQEKMPKQFWFSPQPNIGLSLFLKSLDYKNEGKQIPL